MKNSVIVLKQNIKYKKNTKEVDKQRAKGKNK